MDADEIQQGRERWQRRFDAVPVREADFTTLSGVEVEPVYGPRPGDTVEGFERIGWPGEFPFTRGLYPTGYRGRSWTIRQFAGFGNATQTNERYKMILAAGGGGLSVAFDMPTLMGRDSDDPQSLGEVGHCGVAIDSAYDMEMLFADIPLGDVTTSMTISGPAVPVFCMYLVAAERQGVDLGVLNGTLQTDIFKEYIAQKEWLFPPEPHLRLIGDLMEYCVEHIPAYKPLSVSGYHIREAGSTAAQELAFTLADGFGYVELGLVARPGRRRVRAGPVVLLRLAPGLLRGDREVPGRPADLGALAARRLRREDREGPVAAVPHPDRGRLADRAAAGQQHRAYGGGGAGRGARRHQLAAHQRPGRGARAAEREGGRDRAAHPAGDHGGDRRRQRRRPAGRFLVRRGADRPDRGRGGGRLHPDPGDGLGRLDHLRPAPRHRGRLVHVRDRRGRLHLPDAPWRRARRRSSASTCTPRPSRSRWRSCGSPTRSSASRSGCSAQRRAARDDGRRARPRWPGWSRSARTDANMVPAMLDAARAEATLGEICDALRAEWGDYREPPRF